VGILAIAGAALVAIPFEASLAEAYEGPWCAVRKKPQELCRKRAVRRQL